LNITKSFKDRKRVSQTTWEWTKKSSRGNPKVAGDQAVSPLSPMTSTGQPSMASLQSFPSSEYGGLLVNVGIAAVMVAAKVAGSGFLAKIAVDAIEFKNVPTSISLTLKYASPDLR
jgi:hypothetical protein